MKPVLDIGTGLWIGLDVCLVPSVTARIVSGTSWLIDTNAENAQMEQFMTLSHVIANRPVLNPDPTSSTPISWIPTTPLRHA